MSELDKMSATVSVSVVTKQRPSWFSIKKFRFIVH